MTKATPAVAFIATSQPEKSFIAALASSALLPQKHKRKRWNAGSNNPEPSRLEIKPHIAAPQPTTMLNTSSKHLNGWHDQPLTSATAGRWEKMAYIEHQKQSQNGHSKKPFKVHHQLPGAPVATPEVYAGGFWTT